MVASSQLRGEMDTLVMLKCSTGAVQNTMRERKRKQKIMVSSVKSEKGYSSSNYRVYREKTDKIVFYNIRSAMGILTNRLR